MNGRVFPLLLSAALFLAGAGRAAQGPELVSAATFADYGGSPGSGGIAVSNALGPLEIYAASQRGSGSDRASYWFALQPDAAGGYRQDHVSGASDGILRIQVVQFDGLPGLEVVTVSGDGEVRVHDQATRALVSSFQTQLIDLRAAEVADLDGDGVAEVILARDDRVRVYSSSGTLLHEFLSADGRDIVVADMDLDPGLEFAVTGGQVIDWATRTVQCDWPAGFGVTLAAADVDGDGVHELYYSEAYGSCWRFNAILGLPVWSFPVSDVDVMEMLDVTGDGIEEVVVGRKQSGKLLAYDAVSLLLLWTMDSSQPGVAVRAIALDDFDGDGTEELCWGAGSALHVAEPGASDFEWVSHSIRGPFTPPLEGDFNGDGVAELVSASFESGSFDEGLLLFFDHDLELLHVTDRVEHNDISNQIHDVAVHDIDGDGSEEVIVATRGQSDPALVAYSVGTDFSLRRRWSTPVTGAGTDAFRAVAVGDVDGDGQVEIVGGLANASASWTNNAVYVYDSVTGAEEWRTSFLSTNGGVKDLLLADVDQDGATEIVALLGGTNVSVLDGATGAVEAQFVGSWYAIGIAETGPGQAPYLLFGTGTGELEVRRWTGSTFDLVTYVPLIAGRLWGLQEGAGYLFVGAAGTLEVRTYALNQPPLLVSEPWGTEFAKSLLLGPPNRIYTAGLYSVNLFEVQ